MNLRSGKLPFLGSEDEFFYNTGCTMVPFSRPRRKFRLRPVLKRLKSWFRNNDEETSESPTSAAGFKPFDTTRIEVSAVAKEAVAQRARKLIQASKLPEWLFVAAYPSNRGLVCVGSEDGSPRALLLFTSHLLAKDYIHATGTEAEVGGVKTEDIFESAKEWFSTGVNSFILDRCPRCNVANLIASDALLNREKFLACWAAHTAARSWKGAQLVAQAMGHVSIKSWGEALAALEQIRDHVDCGNPYAHQMIGLFARMLGDQGKVRTAAEHLKDFGPQFAGKTEFSPEDYAEANVGLLASFGMLKSGQAPLTSTDGAGGA